MRARRSGFVSPVIAFCTVFVLMALLPVGVTAATPLLTSTMRSTTAPPIGTVTVDHLNVRSGPSTVYRLVGQLRQGERVPVLQIDGAWAMIYYNGGPNGYGWVYGLYLSDQGVPFATATPTSTVPLSTTTALTLTLPPGEITTSAPQPVNFDGVTFTWHWPGDTAVAPQDWYFDLQLFQDKQADPYEVLVLDLGQIQIENGVYRFSTSLELSCNSTWAVQIAMRSQGRFVRWLSQRSEKMPLGPNCAEG